MGPSVTPSDFQPLSPPRLFELYHFVDEFNKLIKIVNPGSHLDTNHAAVKPVGKPE